jgi:hypothetical protein
LFEEAGKEKIIGEATADYLIDPDSPQAIFDFAKDAHIIGILRNPFDAAYSEFLMNQREGEFTREVTFLEALRAENIKDHSLWSLPRLIRTRLYHQHVRRYLDIFPKEQIRLFLFEDLAEPKKLLTETFSFLGVSTEVEIDVSLKYNSTVARSNNANLQAALYRISPSIRSGLRKVLPTSLLDHYRNRRLRANRPEKPPVRCPDEAREFLLPILTPVIQELEELVSRDLSAWLE